MASLCLPAGLTALILCHVQMSADRVVLDGEMLVWNKTRGVFEPFGGLRSAMNAANKGEPADHVSRTEQTPIACTEAGLSAAFDRLCPT